MSGVYWGYAEAMFTPAFWAAQAWYHRSSTRYSNFVWGDDLRREIVGCLLGGHGISSEINQAAFERLDQSGLLERSGPIDEEEILKLLRIPFTLAGRPVRYRFAAQKSRFIAAATRKIEQQSKPIGEAIELRKWLLSFPGIGMKTASWITRNHLRTNTVAVIDIHIFRAGVIMGLYSGGEVVSRA
jgi:N-glycosylase/DNA lyase